MGYYADYFSTLFKGLGPTVFKVRSGTSKLVKEVGKEDIMLYKKAIIGGSIIALLIFIFPPLFGEGYESIKVLSSINPNELMNKSILSVFADNEWFVLFFIGAVMLIKVIATSVTISSAH